LNFTVAEVKETSEHHEMEDNNELSKVTTTFVEGTTRLYDGGRLRLIPRPSADPKGTSSKVIATK
jgi:hypothetical protein